jgi:hypothetical protein
VYQRNTAASLYSDIRRGYCSLAHLPSSSIFEEIPIKIRNPHLIQAFMLDLVTRHTITTSIRGAATANATAAIDRAGLPGTLGVADEGDTEFSRLDLNAAPFLEKHMEALSDVTNSLLRASVEAFSSRQRKQRDEQRVRGNWWVMFVVQDLFDSLCRDVRPKLVGPTIPQP